MSKRFMKTDFKDNNGEKKRVKYDDDNDDVGIVHYRDTSDLLRSPPGYGVRSPMKHNNKALISLKDGSLFNMCLKFISVNIDLLDSLVGFPEIIGQQLLSYMIYEQIFDFKIDSNGLLSSHDKMKLKKLALFDEAYDELLMKSLNLTQIHKNFEITPLILSFQNLVELDLSGRILPDEIFCVISKLSCLEKLILQDNKLTDKSIKRFTLPYRMYKENPQELEILDISDNKSITNRSIELILTFKSLKTLNLTGTSIKMNYDLVYELKQFGWQLSRDEPTYDKPLTVGWAEPIISHLHIQNNPQSISNPKAAKFYSKKAETSKTAEMSKLVVKRDTLILLHTSVPNNLAKFNRSVLVDTGQTKSDAVGLNKRKSVLKIHSKKKTFAIAKTDIDEDEDSEESLFRQYTGCTADTARKNLFACLNQV